MDSVPDFRRRRRQEIDNHMRFGKQNDAQTDSNLIVHSIIYTRTHLRVTK